MSEHIGIGSDTDGWEEATHAVDDASLGGEGAASSLPERKKQLAVPDLMHKARSIHGKRNAPDMTFQFAPDKSQPGVQQRLSMFRHMLLQWG